MCGYVLYINLCGCYGEFECDTSCDLIVQELDRINAAESWTASMIDKLPFAFPDACLPGWNNTLLVWKQDYCSPLWFYDCPTLADVGGEGQ